jgi:hypothetical protein
VRFFVTTSFRDMQNLHDRFKAVGWLPAQAHRQLTNRLTAVRQAEAVGNDQRALLLLNQYKQVVAEVANTEVRAALTRDADAMIVRLGGSSVKGTGRLPGDATTVPEGGKLD